MATLRNKTIKPIKDRVLVSDMDFGEQTTKGGIIINSDDGKAHGVYPRWGRVFATGPEQTDVKVGEWVLVAHGRWTRGMDLVNDVDGEEVTTTIRMVENEAMLAISDEKPTGHQIGKEFTDGPATIRPEEFGAN
jgi:co-chaperonin GroES (HSP10)